MSKTAVLVHGKGGSPDASWLPWLAHELTQRSYSCVLPTFPHNDDSKLAEWFSVFGRLDDDYAQTTFVAHARGAMALLRWINTLPRTTRVDKIIIVSCNFDFQPNRTDGDEFYAKPLDYDDIILKCPHVVVIHSQDDPYVPISAGEQLAQKIHGRFVGYETAGHFGSDKITAPEILQQIDG